MLRKVDHIAPPTAGNIVLATEAKEGTDVADATLAPENKTDSDSAAADTAQNQDGDQDA